MKFSRLNQAPIKYCLPAFFFQWFHAQGPHDLPDCDGGIAAIRIFLLRMMVEILLETVMQIDFIVQPWVNSTPCGGFRFLVKTLLDDTKTLSMVQI